MFCVNKYSLDKILEFINNFLEGHNDWINMYLKFKNNTELFYFIIAVNYLNIIKLIEIIDKYIPILYPDFCGKKSPYIIFSLELDNSCIHVFNYESIINNSGTLKNMYEDTCLEENNIFPILTITKDTFIRILEYCFYKSIIQDEEQFKQKLIEIKYLSLQDEDIFKLILASNFLFIQSLLDLTCSKIAEYISECDTSEEIRKRFNIKNDFTPEEEEEIKRETEIMAS